MSAGFRDYNNYIGLKNFCISVHGTLLFIRKVRPFEQNNASGKWNSDTECTLSQDVL